MKLNLHEVRDNKVWDGSVTLPAADFNLDTPERPRVTAPVDAVLHAEVADDVFLILGRFNASISIPCARCLEDYKAPIQGDFDAEAPLRQDTFDVTEEVRQSLLLALPVKPLCQPQCLGICAHCGKNRNREACRCADETVNHPFEKLRQIKIV